MPLYSSREKDASKEFARRAQEFSKKTAKNFADRFREYDAIEKAQRENTAYKAAQKAAAKKQGREALRGSGKAARKAVSEAVRENTALKAASKLPRAGVFSRVARRAVGRAFIPAGIALDLYATGKAVKEGYKAIQADAHRRRTKEYNKRLYGSIEAATRTRKHREMNK